jgi:hypothetical protein
MFIKANLNIEEGVLRSILDDFDDQFEDPIATVFNKDATQADKEEAVSNIRQYVTGTVTRHL